MPQDVRQAIATALTAERDRTARGLARSNPLSLRSHTPPRPLVTGPEITLRLATDGTLISGSSLVPMSSDLFTYLACPAGLGPTFPDQSFYRPDNIASWDGSRAIYAPGPWAVEFEWYGTAFEFYTTGNGTNARYRITVDGFDLPPEECGYDVRSGRSDLPNNGAGYLVKYDFTTPAFRRIRFDMNSNCRFGGIRREAIGSIWKSSKEQGDAITVIGDSFVGGAASVQMMNTFPEMMGWLLGCYDVDKSGGGGTGYINTFNGTRTAYGTRLLKDVIAFAPKIVIFTGGINDQGIYTYDDQLAAARAAFSQVKSALPSSTVIVDGPQWKNGGPNVGIITMRDAVRTAARLEQVDLYIEEIGGPYPYNAGGTYNFVGWMTGTGYSGHEVGNGNADIFTDTDNTHPTQRGQDYRGQRLASAILTWVKAGSPKGAVVIDGTVTVP